MPIYSDMSDSTFVAENLLTMPQNGFMRDKSYCFQGLVLFACNISHCSVFCCYTGSGVYALSSVSAAEIDRLMREATRKRSTSISIGCIDGMTVFCLSFALTWETLTSLGH